MTVQHGQWRAGAHAVSPIVRRWIIVLLAMPVLAVGVACSDPAPTVERPAVVDSVGLEDAAERVEAAADRVDRGVEPFAAAPAADVSEFEVIFVKAEALRLLALLSQIEIELDMIDAIIEPRADSRPGSWPLERENAAALEFASLRLYGISFQLSDFVRELTEPSPVFVDESILAALTELEAEMKLIRSSTYELREAHEAGEPLVAPATRLTTVARTRIERLIEAISGLLAGAP